MLLHISGSVLGYELKSCVFLIPKISISVYKKQKMEKNILWDLFCFQCSLQFDKKSIYDMHLSIIHKYEKRKESILMEIKTEPEEMKSSLKSSDTQENLREEQILNKNSDVMKKQLKQGNEANKVWFIKK